MIARAGTCTATSALIVALAAVVLHRAEAVRAKPAPSAAASPKVNKPPVPPATPNPPQGKTVTEQPIAVETAAPAPPAPVQQPRRPSSGFVTVKEGETLNDVGRRVYGDGFDITALWKINRDQLPEIDSALRAGMLLRTPVF